MLQRLLRNTIRTGRLSVHLDRWRAIEVGRPALDRPGLDVAVRLRGWLTPIKLALNPDLFLGEAYMNGDVVIERGTLWDLMDIIGRNLNHRPSWTTLRLGRAYDALRSGVRRAISPITARRNAAHHYDLSLALYREFLDPDLQYSCAYFAEPSLTLAAAQQAKKRHIVAKLMLKPGQRVLDIGCGWGGLALAMAEADEVTVTGVTLSLEQLKVCRERARNAGLHQKVTFELCDYREVRGQFDRIVSVGMFEHVGVSGYDTFFQSIGDLLTDDGVALLHSIGQRGRPGSAANAWIDRYIFPGGYIPALSEVTASVERTGLWISDIEILRLHYAETLKRWREAFASRASLICDLYDERFVRMWEFYLAGSEMGFRHADLMVFQAQLCKRVDAVPLTRDYMVDAERSREKKERAAMRSAPSRATS